MTRAFHGRTPVFNVQKTRALGDGARLGPDVITSCNQSAFAPIATASSAIAGHRPLDENTSTNRPAPEYPREPDTRVTKQLSRFRIHRDDPNGRLETKGTRARPAGFATHANPQAMVEKFAQGFVRRGPLQLLGKASAERRVRRVRNKKEMPQIPATHASELMASSVRSARVATPTAIDGVF